jgi:sugar lactone lactonase YvrE
MSRTISARLAAAALIAVVVASCQISEGGTAATAASNAAPYPGYVAPGYVESGGTVQPVNHLPNPYETQRNWGTLPNGRTWGSVSALEVDLDGQHLWVAERCGTNRCTGFTQDVIFKFDPQGNVVTSFGAGRIIWPHGMHIDRDGNVWVTDASSADEEELVQFPGERNKGHAVYKFSPTGELLLTLGTPGVRGNGTGAELAEPNDVITAPNGDIYVAEAHSGQNLDAPTPTTVARIAKFSADGTYLTSFGTFGPARGQLRTPHALAFDSQGRLFVADRGNNRLVIYDQSGTVLDEWKQFSRISGLVITQDDVLYAIDSESGPRNPGWRKGLRVGSARTGEVWYYVPQHDSEQSSGGGGFGAMGEGVAVDAAGNVFGGEVGPVQGITKFVPRLGMLAP